MNTKKELVVSALEEGTVIDHIPSGSLFKVISILKLEKIDTMITFGSNLESKKLGSKAIIKIAHKFFEQEEIDKIALVAPEAKLNIIKDYQVVEKRIVNLPDEIKSICRCMNPKCITNHQQVPTRFYVVDKKNVTLKCRYCEKNTDQEHLEIF